MRALKPIAARTRRKADGPVEARRRSPREDLAAMLASEELRALDAIAAPFDPLEVLTWTRQERPHTHFLAWMLDPVEARPGGGHGLGAAALQALIERAVSLVETLPGVDSIALPRRVEPIDPDTLTVTRELPLGDGIRTTARAPDLQCAWRDARGDAWLVLIENKVDASEGDGQVRDYLAWAAKHHPDARRMLLYITPDGHAPESSGATPEVVVPMTWSDVADACLDALSRSRDAPAFANARAFAAATLEALRARFGGRSDARALIEALYDAHPRAAALVASPATDAALLVDVRAQRPNAAWHLRALRPRAHRWTRSWAERVAAHFAELCPDAPALTACAPHLAQPDMASWSIEAVTQALSLYAFCTPGAAFGGHRPRAWIALRAPNLGARDVFESRDQHEALDALPESTRAWLLGAAPVTETHGSWRWLCVGAPSVLTRGWSLDDDARRAARALRDHLAPHLDALRAVFGAPSLRLYSCDLDPDHVLPHDAHDRVALARDAHPQAERVLVLTRQPTGHPYELRRACELGAALGAAFGAARSLAYDYAPAGSLAEAPFARPTAVIVALDLFRGPDDASLGEAVATLHAALAGGAWLALIDAPRDVALARRHLGSLVDADPSTRAWRVGTTRVVRAGAPRLDAIARWWQGLVALAASL